MHQRFVRASCDIAVVAKRKRKPPRVVPTAAPAAESPLDLQSAASLLASIGRGAQFYAEDPPLFRAQQLMFDAFETDGLRRVELAREALAISPDCADAYLLLAEEAAPTLEEARALLEQGVAAGERALGPRVFTEDAGDFWSLVETRPYMRARAALAALLWKLGCREEALEHGRELLRLNPNDNQGVRYQQAEWLLWLERFDELDVLLSQYEDDCTAAFAYTKALAGYRCEGDSPETRRLLTEARAVNPHVPAYLTGKKRLPRRLPDYVGFGDASEAVDYAAGAAAIWASVPGAVDWLTGRLRLAA